MTRPESLPHAGDDAEDVARATQGDSAAFERLYRRHVARINSLAHRMIGPDRAAEVTQDSFVRAWQKLGSFRGESQFGTWLYRLAINLILSKRAQFARIQARETADEEAVDRHPSRPASTEFGLDFETAIGRLPEGAKQIFVLHDIEGYKHEEIAAMLDVTTGTSKAQLHRARMLMRRVLGKQ